MEKMKKNCDITKNDFRVKEHNDKYTIQRKIVEIENTGILWWKTQSKITYWGNINENGNIYLNSVENNVPMLDSFKKLKSALNKIDSFIKGISYHYPTN